MAETDDVEEEEEGKHEEEDEPNQDPKMELLRNRIELILYLWKLVGRLKLNEPLLGDREEESQKKEREQSKHY